MKKLSLFVAPIMAASFLIGCGGGGGDKPKAPEFSITDEIRVEGKDAFVKIDWTPSGDIINFSNFTYTYGGSEEVTVTEVSGAGVRPYEVKISFETDIAVDTEGALRFNYEDTTSGVKALNESIVFTIPAPDPHEVNETEFHAALGFNDVDYLQTNDGTYERKFSPNAYFERINETAETYIFKANDKYNRYFSQDPTADGFIFIEDAGNSGYYTPQTYTTDYRCDGPSYIISDLYGLEYSDFEYDKSSGAYTAIHQISGTILTLKFENKKIVSLEIENPGNDGESFTYAYEEEDVTAPQDIQEFDELDLSDTADPTNINVVDGRIYIDFTNAGEKLTTSTSLSVQCLMEGEDFNVEIPDSAYSSVYGYWKGGTATQISYDVDEDGDIQLWNFEPTNIEGDFYLTIVLNENFEAPKTGRTMIKNLTKEISCSLNKKESLYTICINFTEITEEPTTL